MRENGVILPDCQTYAEQNSCKHKYNSVGIKRKDGINIRLYQCSKCRATYEEVTSMGQITDMIRGKR